jgi:hypothetical protein
MVNIRVFPAIPKIAFIGIETNQPAFVNQSETLGGLIVVLVDLGQAILEVILLVINGMIKGKFHEIEFRKHFFHLGPDIRIQAVIIVDVKKSACQQIIPEVLGFLFVEENIPVTGHVDKRIVEYLKTACFYRGIIFCYAGIQIVVAVFDKIG